MRFRLGLMAVIIVSVSGSARKTDTRPRLRRSHRRSSLHRPYVTCRRRPRYHRVLATFWLACQCVLELHIAEVQANRAARQLRSRARNLLSPRVRVVPSRAAPASRGHVAQARPRVSAHRGRARAMPLLPDSPQCHRPHRLSYEQVAKLVLQPQLADAAERTEDAEAARVRARSGSSISKRRWLSACGAASKSTGRRYASCRGSTRRCR